MTDKIITDSHRQIFTDVKSYFKNGATYIEESWFRPRGGQAMEIFGWLTNGKFLIQGSKPTIWICGSKWTDDLTIEEVRNPTIETPTVKIEYKTHWFDWLIRGIATFGIISTFFFNYTDNAYERTIHELEDKNIRQLLSIDSLSKQVHSLDSLLEISRRQIDDNHIK